MIWWWLRLIIFSGLVVAILLLQVIAWFQVKAMTQYGPADGQKTDIGRLSLLDKLKVGLTGVTVPRPINRITPADHGLSYTTTMLDLPSGERIESWVIPQAANAGVIILLPGYAISKADLLPLAIAFQHKHYNVLMVDFRGTGGSTGNKTTLGIQEAEEVVYAFKFARQQWPGRPIILYGVSMGTAALLRSIHIYAISPDAIVLESPFK